MKPFCSSIVPSVKCSYALGASLNGNSWETIKPGWAVPAMIRSRLPAVSLGYLFSPGLFPPPFGRNVVISRPVPALGWSALRCAARELLEQGLSVSSL